MLTFVSITLLKKTFPIKPPVTDSVVVASSSLLTAAYAFGSVGPPTSAA